MDNDDEPNGNNDLIYDEFFLRDNDFGSDADSDGEDMAATMIKSNHRHGFYETVECLGPYFMTPNDKNSGNNEKAQQRLQMYTSYSMIPIDSFPTLGVPSSSKSKTENDNDATATGDGKLSAQDNLDGTETTKRVVLKEWTPEMVIHKFI